MEAANTVRLVETLTDMPSVVVPTIHGKASTARVLTLDFVRVARVDDLDALRFAGASPPDVSARVTDLFLRMVFNDGFFRADPHPGNLLVDERGWIGLIDFGMVGEARPVDQDAGHVRRG